MKFRYLSAYAVTGLIPPKNGELYTLLSDAGQGKSAWLAGPSHPVLHQIIRAETIGILAFDKAFKGTSFDELENRFLTRKNDWFRQFENSAFLILEAYHDEDATNLGQITEPANHNFCLTYISRFADEFEAKHSSFSAVAQALLSFAFPNVAGSSLVRSCNIGNYNGKDLHVIRFSVGVPTVSTSITQEGVEALTKMFACWSNLTLSQTVFRLYADSLSDPADNLRAFLFAFTALEVFLKSRFSKQKERLCGPVRHSVFGKTQSYVERIERNLRDTGHTGDFPLAYNFALIAADLGLGKLDDRLDEFDLAQESRNAIVHGRKFVEAQLPIVKVRTLLGDLILLSVGADEGVC
jgi:hypothetical protein